MIDFNCEHFRKEDGCRWCCKFNNLICDLCHKDDEDASLDRFEY